MTTIATDGKTMAGDGQITDGDRVCMSDYQKVRRLPDGRLVGVCGEAYNWGPFWKWLEEGGDFPKLSEKFTALVLHPDGSCESIDERGYSFPEQPPFACGSGGSLALGAMDAGKTAGEAVQIACGRDVWSSGTITVLELHPKAKLEAA